MSTGDCSAEVGVKDISCCSPGLWPLAYFGRVLFAQEYAHKSMLWVKKVGRSEHQDTECRGTG